jgi:energy-coupling factor transporter ATP-binding protein EcfA2
LGFLTKSDAPVVKKPSDFSSTFEGGSKEIMRKIMDDCQGRVLVLDEAYMLISDDNGRQVLDTIVDRTGAFLHFDSHRSNAFLILETDGNGHDNIAIILCGYKSQLEKMLREANPGLRSRFSPESELEFEDFSDEDLLRKIDSEFGSRASLEVKMHCVRRLGKLRNMPGFGNARSCEVLAKQAIQNAEIRSRSDGSFMVSSNVSITPKDIDFNHGNDPLSLVEQFEMYGSVFYEYVLSLCHRVKLWEKEGRRAAESVGHMLFLGNSGTGKTSAANNMSGLLYSLGLVSKKQIVRKTAKDFIQPYDGQTEGFVASVLEESRGGVLFIDEAYEFKNSRYGNDALGVLVGKLDDPDFANGKTVVIMAGYTPQMEEMLAKNQGLASKCPSRLYFEDWTNENMMKLIEKTASQNVPTPFIFVDDARQELEICLESLRTSKTRTFGNARDAVNMFKRSVERRDNRVARNPEETARDQRGLLVTREDVKLGFSDLCKDEKVSLTTPNEGSDSLVAAGASFQSCSEIFEDALQGWNEAKVAAKVDIVWAYVT